MDCVPLADMRLRLAREPVVHLVVVCVDPDPAQAARAIKSAAGQTRQPIFAVTTNDEASVRESIEQAGATAVWTLNNARDGLLKATEELRRNGTLNERRGRLIAVTGALPGSGVTTVATGLAFALAGKSPVALAELSPGTPELALDLDLTSRHSLADLIQAGDRLDASMIREAAAHHQAGVDVLAYAPETLTPEVLTAEVARDFQILLRVLYEWVVVDAGHLRPLEQDEVVRHADLVVLVARLDPPSLRLTRRYLQALVNLGMRADQLLVVVNRYGQSGQVAWRKAEEVLKAPVASWLPDDPKAVNRALVDGQPLVQVARGAKLTRELTRLATDLRNRYTTFK
jgi:pilus assembly protein CpaE